ncbi:MAG: hypothetical protein LBH47_02945 [Christensenellaceae bacterium]|jgi:hypothetical protein|nr:hypothetical protein [Christensenellaceae bacterium]
MNKTEKQSWFDIVAIAAGLLSMTAFALAIYFDTAVKDRETSGLIFLIAGILVLPVVVFLLIYAISLIRDKEDRIQLNREREPFRVEKKYNGDYISEDTNFLYNTYASQDDVGNEMKKLKQKEEVLEKIETKIAESLLDARKTEIEKELYDEKVMPISQMEFEKRDKDLIEVELKREETPEPLPQPIIIPQSHVNIEQQRRQQEEPQKQEPQEQEIEFDFDEEELAKAINEELLKLQPKQEPKPEPIIEPEMVVEPEMVAEPIIEPEMVAEPEVVAEPIIEPEVVAEPAAKEIKVKEPEQKQEIDTDVKTKEVPEYPSNANIVSFEIKKGKKADNKKLIFTPKNLQRYINNYFIEIAACFLMNRDEFKDTFGTAPYNKITIKASDTPGQPNSVIYSMVATHNKLYGFAEYLVDMERFITNEELYHNFISLLENGTSLARITEQIHALIKQKFLRIFINNMKNRENIENIIVLSSNNYILDNNNFKTVFNKVPFEIATAFTNENVISYLSNPDLEAKFIETFPNYGEIGLPNVWTAMYVCFINSIKNKLTPQQLEDAILKDAAKVSRALKRNAKLRGK